MLASWNASMVLPDHVTDDMLNLAVADATAALTPATVQTFAVTISELFEYAWAFDIGSFAGLSEDERRKKTAAQSKLYREALEDIPADLLALSVKRIRTSWKWGNKMPMPADLREAISDEMAKRKSSLARPQMALKFGKRMYQPSGQGRSVPVVNAKAVPLYAGEQRRDQ